MIKKHVLFLNADGGNEPIIARFVRELHEMKPELEGKAWTVTVEFAEDARMTPNDPSSPTAAEKEVGA